VDLNLYYRLIAASSYENELYDCYFL